MKTYIESARGTRYIVSWTHGLFCREVFERIVRYYCRANKQFEVTFSLGHGSRFITLSVDCLLLSKKQDRFIEDMLVHLEKQNVTGVRTEDRDEAVEVEQEIIKGYEWAVLKS